MQMVMVSAGEGTVKTHMTHILEKAGCAGREALAERVRGLSSN